MKQRRPVSEAVAAAIARSGAQAQEAPTQKPGLDAIAEKAKEARALEREIEDLKSRLAEKQQALNDLYMKQLPDLFEVVGVDKIGVTIGGNEKPLDAVLTPFYSANIAAGWDQDKRTQAFAYLESIGEGDLIKTTITLDLPRGSKELAERIVQSIANNPKIKKLGCAPALKENVHPQTLTAWLKNQVEEAGFMPDLEKIGGTVGRVVKLKERKE